MVSSEGCEAGGNSSYGSMEGDDLKDARCMSRRAASISDAGVRGVPGGEGEP